MSVARELGRAEWRARRRAYLVLLVLFAATSGTYAVVLSLVGGLEDNIGGELSDNLAADIRVSNGAQGVADGEDIAGWRDVSTRLAAAAPDARVAPRLELEALFAHGGGFATGRSEEPNVARSAGILVGIDGPADAEVADIGRYLTRGVRIDEAPAYETPRGERLVPIIVGERFLETTNATVADGAFSWRAVFNFTAGRLENGQLVVERGIVVGAYSTGFRMIDRAVVYAPRGDVARLVGGHPGDPPANVLLVATHHPETVARAAAEAGFTTMDAAEFRETYLGPVFDTVRAVAWAVVAMLTLMTAGWFAHTLGHHVRADRRKIATLRAIGIPTEAFTRMYVGLGAALGLAGGIVGVGAALALGFLVFVVTSALPLVGARPFVPQASAVELLGLVLLAAATAAAAARVALRRLGSEGIRDALRAP